MVRRKFIKKASGVVAGIVLTSSIRAWASTSEVQNQDFPIIDTHQHLWDIERLKLEWPIPPIDNRDFLIPEYKKATAGFNFVKSIYMEVDVPPKLRRDEALFALEICKDSSNNTVKAVICANPAESDFRDFLSEFIGNEFIRGVRCRFDTVSEMTSTKSISNLQWLGKQGLSFDLGIRPEWLGASELLVKACPDTIFILNHCGNADPVAFFLDSDERPRPPKCDPVQWKKDIALLGSYQNIYCKISGIVSHVPNFELNSRHLRVPINHCIDSFGEDKIIFAGDWPVCLYNMTLKKWVKTLKEIVEDRPLVIQKKLFHDNAAFLYGI
ncbi:MAG: amidohydrolase family protein [Maribacter sp.]